jgi:protein-S-isoprenylcysteine O-methyltransferase Ste14
LISLLVYLLYLRGIAWSIIELPGWVQWVGAVVGVVGEVLLAWSHYVLGENFFGGMKIREGHELVEEGPYRWVRHPIYTAFIALGIGLFLLTESWMVGVPWLASIGLALATRMVEEEAMMIEQFGEAYEEYEARTGRFLPRLRSSDGT